jgi:hypothetical protein
MAAPRMFVSSTCYDLHEIRHSLRNFIAEFQYEPVMSDYGDVFYEFDQHVQDSCLNEIAKSQMYILIIGNNYGSVYHGSANRDEYPDSVTLAEFRKSIALKIPKMIFVNKFVNYDYKNYQKALNQNLAEYFRKNPPTDLELETQKLKLHSQFDQRYPFPQTAYKYIFRFMDEISSLNKNNAVFEYETFDEIKSQLKKQWAGYLYDRLTESKEDSARKESEITFEEIKSKLSILENLLADSVKNRKEGSSGLAISLDSVEKSLVLDQLKSAQELLENSINGILYEFDYNDYPSDRLAFKKKLTLEAIVSWLESLEGKVATFKWSRTIPTEELFIGIECKFYENRSEVDLESVIKLNALFKSLAAGERESFSKVVLVKLAKLQATPTPAADDFDPHAYEDDIPF